MQNEITHILCAVRGQPESRATVIRAIELASQHDAWLTFLLILDPEFVTKATPTLASLDLVYRRLEEIGEFSMTLLIDRAHYRGVKKVDYQLRRGKVPKQLLLAAKESNAQLMVMGRPLDTIGRNVFTPQEFDQFVLQVESQTPIKVIQVIRENAELE